jgi:hypothetical protein
MATVVYKLVHAAVTGMTRDPRDQTARTDAGRAAVREALRVTEANVVSTPLIPPKGGIVITHPASPGERLAQGDSVISIAATSTMVVFARWDFVL